MLSIHKMLFYQELLRNALFSRLTPKLAKAK